MESLEPVTSGFLINTEMDISFFKPIFSSLINHFERLNKKSMEISPFSE
jgi:hypothetical protein